jgi:hypothetical protein
MLKQFGGTLLAVWRLPGLGIYLFLGLVLSIVGTAFSLTSAVKRKLGRRILMGVCVGLLVLDGARLYMDAMTSSLTLAALLFLAHIYLAFICIRLMKSESSKIQCNR